MKRILALVLLASLSLACQMPFSADEKSTLRTGSFELRLGEGYSFTDAKDPDIALGAKNPDHQWTDLYLLGQIKEGEGDIAPYAGNWLDGVFIAQYIIEPGTSTIVREAPSGRVMLSDSARVTISLPQSYFLLCSNNIHFAKITIQEPLFFLCLDSLYLAGFVIDYAYQARAGDHNLKP